MNILEEANSLVHGDRNVSYGHPLDDMTRTAGMVSAALAGKLREPLRAEDIALIMALVKISRQINAEKRDNMTDLAGYAECWNWIIEERERRNALATEIESSTKRGQLTDIDLLSMHIEPQPIHPIPRVTPELPGQDEAGESLLPE